MIDDSHYEFRALTLASDDLVSPEERGDETALRTVLSAGNVSDPDTAALDRTREGILVSAQDSWNPVSITVVFVVHRGVTLRSAQTDVRAIVGEHARPTRHLGVPDIVREILVGFPVDDQFWVWHWADLPRVAAVRLYMAPYRRT